MLESQILSGPKEKKKEGYHDQPLPKVAAQGLLPLFERLTKADLLECYVSLGTSNANESLLAVTAVSSGEELTRRCSAPEIAVALADK